MEIGTWILLLLFYLIVSYLRKKKRTPVQKDVRSWEKARRIAKELETEDLMPDWFKEIILPKESMAPEEDQIEIEDVPTYEMEEEKIDQPVEPIRYEGPTDEEALSPLYSVFDKKRERAIMLEKQKVQEYKKDITAGLSHKRFTAHLTTTESLREIILLKEILGPPRALKRYNRRDFT